MKPIRKVIRPGELEFFLRLHGLWEGLIHLARHRHPSTSTPWSPSRRPGRPSKNGSPTTNPTSTGSTAQGILQIPTRTSSTKGWRGGHPKSNWTATTSWSSKIPDSAPAGQKINCCRIYSWHCSLGKLCSDHMPNAMEALDCAQNRRPDALSLFQLFSSAFPPQSPPARTLFQWLTAKK